MTRMINNLVTRSVQALVALFVLIAAASAQPATTITGVTPSSGPTAGGTNIVITGTGIPDPGSTSTIGVRIGGVAATNVVWVSATQVNARTPAGTAGAKNVQILLDSTVVATGTNLFTYTGGAPSVTGISPNSGPTAGGTNVTITGTGFTGATGATVGGNALASFSVVSDTQVTGVTPAGTPGAKNVVVNGTGGPGTGVNLFTYVATPVVTSVSPNVGPLGGGTAITITGSGFTGADSATIGTVAITSFSVVDDTTITGVTPAGGTTGSKTVSVIGAGGSTGPVGTLPNGFTYDNVPPVLIVSANITQNTDPGLATAVVNYPTPTATDNIPGPINILRTSGPVSGSAFPIGTTTVTFVAIDASGNTATASFTVTVVDAEPPQIVGLPANQSFLIDYPETGRVVTFTAPTATDNAPGVTIVQTAGLPSGSTFPVGTTTNAFKATDANGNTATAQFTVTVAVIPPGSINFVVRTQKDGTFVFTSGQSSLNFTINTSNGEGQSGAILIKPGTYPATFTVPDGFGLTSASCTPSPSAIDLAAKTAQIVLVSGQAVTCTLSAVAARDEAHAAIGNFLGAVANLIIANGPDLNRRLDRFGDGGESGGNLTIMGVNVASALPFSFKLDAEKMSFSYSLSRSRAAERAELRRTLANSGGDLSNAAAGNAALGAKSGSMPGGGDRFDLWVEGTVAKFDASGGDGTFAIVHGGADYLVNRNLLVGLGVQADWSDMDTAPGGTVSGRGFMAGPYVTGKLSQNLFFDGRAAWGTSENKVSPFGTYEDEFSTTRRLYTGALIGSFQDGKMTVRPEVRATWFAEETDAYRDSLGVDIPSIEVKTGQVAFGPELRWALMTDGGATISPHIKIDGIWTFQQDYAGTAATATPGQLGTGLRARAETGLTYQAGDDLSISASAFYDGIGDDDYNAWGLSLQLSKSF